MHIIIATALAPIFTLAIGQVVEQATDAPVDGLTIAAILGSLWAIVMKTARLILRRGELVRMIFDVLSQRACNGDDRSKALAAELLREILRQAGDLPKEAQEIAHKEMRKHDCHSILDDVQPNGKAPVAKAIGRGLLRMIPGAGRFF